jgi:putative SOS response-associated peptidase YedK
MCGRFFRHTPREELSVAFQADVGFGDAPLGYNVSPTQSVLAVRFDPKHETRTLDELHWGLIPFFAKERKIAWRTINARAETVDTTPSYRNAFAKRRCLVAADGFFEWRTVAKRKMPYAIALKSRRAFGIAGLWENWQDPETGEWIRSCAIITTTPNSLVANIHDRMPVILEPDQYARWLGQTAASPEELKAMLQPYAAEAMEMWPVSPRLNKPGVGEQDASLLEPIQEPQPSLPASNGRTR